MSFSQKKYSNEYEVDFIKSENGKVYCTIFTYCKNEKQCLENAKVDAIKTALFRGFTSDIKLYPIIRNLDIEKENKKVINLVVINLKNKFILVDLSKAHVKVSLFNYFIALIFEYLFLTHEYLL